MVKNNPRYRSFVTRAIARQRISVDELGNIDITGDTKLYITIDDMNHTVYYYNKKGGSEAGASIVSFKINKELLRYRSFVTSGIRV